MAGGRRWRKTKKDNNRSSLRDQMPRNTALVLQMLGPYSSYSAFVCAVV